VALSQQKNMCGGPQVEQQRWLLLQMLGRLPAPL
jgi:hypothetical protein